MAYGSADGVASHPASYMQFYEARPNNGATCSQRIGRAGDEKQEFHYGGLTFYVSLYISHFSSLKSGDDMVQPQSSESSLESLHFVAIFGGYRIFFLINAALLYSAKPSTAVIFQFQ